MQKFKENKKNKYSIKMNYVFHNKDIISIIMNILYDSNDCKTLHNLRYVNRLYYSLSNKLEIYKSYKYKIYLIKNSDQFRNKIINQIYDFIYDIVDVSCYYSFDCILDTKNINNINDINDINNLLPDPTPGGNNRILHLHHEDNQLENVYFNISMILGFSNKINVSTTLNTIDNMLNTFFHTLVEDDFNWYKKYHIYDLISTNEDINFSTLMNKIKVIYNYLRRLRLLNGFSF